MLFATTLYDADATNNNSDTSTRPFQRLASTTPPTVLEGDVVEPSQVPKSTLVDRSTYTLLSGDRTNLGKCLSTIKEEDQFYALDYRLDGSIFAATGKNHVVSMRVPVYENSVGGRHGITVAVVVVWGFYSPEPTPLSWLMTTSANFLDKTFEYSP